ncbi:MAG: redoxin domain-containing protein [Candidatus Aenigmarchaeota archaeon]|nr:redoxin domain-containing protein [Candidatus Aenigmarchaeota archaeon]
MVNVGEEAPDFELKDQFEKAVTLKEHNGGKVLLAFFPFAFSPVCTDEMKCFQDDLSELENLGVHVIAISIDSDWSQKAWAEQLGIKYHVLSDFSRDVCKLYDTLRPEGFSERAYFLIDENGIVKWKHIMSTPAERLENKEIIAAIKNI